MADASRRPRDRGLHEILRGDDGESESARAPVTLTIVRHGATKLNGQSGVSVDRERGWSNVPLTGEGRQEAREAAAKLKDAGIEVIVSSDLVRAKETAQIIGDELGIKPEFSFKLRPWNLGELTGKVMTEAKPQIAAYAKKPDAKVPGGESFHAFCDRAFQGLGEAVAHHRGKRILIVAHHRVERLIAGWDNAGQRPDHSIDLKTFMADGDPPGGIMVLDTSEEALKGEDGYFAYMDGGVDMDGGEDAPRAKLSHAQVKYGLAKGADKCANCKSYRGKDDCIKVVNPIYPAGWCNVGHSKADGHAFSGEASETPAQEAAESPQYEAQEQRAGVERDSSQTLAHGRAIAGAKALHAVGHISEAQRDRHIAKSQKAIGKAAPRKPFGAFAPQ